MNLEIFLVHYKGNWMVFEFMHSKKKANKLYFFAFHLRRVPGKIHIHKKSKRALQLQGTWQIVLCIIRNSMERNS